MDIQKRSISPRTLKIRPIGGKGRADATIIDDKTKALEYAKKMAIKYTGGLDNPMSQSVIRQAQLGLRIVVELDPIFYSTWDYGRNR